MNSRNNPPQRPNPSGPNRSSLGERLTSYRGKHRSASHESAHADEATDHAALPRFDHPLVPNGEARLVLTQPELDDTLAHLRAAGTFAFDTEFIGESSFHPRLCLIQIATAERVVLIDPMVNLDLGGFWQLVCDPSLTKIVHAGDQDLPFATRSTGCPPANVFDAQVAAGFCSMAYPVALAKLVNEVLGVQLAKGLTFTQWDARPLSAKQLRYAADDVRFLPAVHADLTKRLAANGNLPRLLDECAVRCDPERWRFDAEADYLDIRAAGTLDGKQLSVLKQLVIWRRAVAEEQDLPPRVLLKDDVLIDLSRHPPRTPEKLNNVRGLPRPVIESYGGQILETVAKAWTNPVPVPPKPPEPSPSDRFKIDAVWAVAQTLAMAAGIDSTLVCGRQDATDLYFRFVQGEDTLALPVMTGWRREAVGETLGKLLATDLAVPVRLRDAMPRVG
jgi:ribonuclease D